MQQVELELREDYEFYCPITGQQILSVDDFIPSPAMVFCYLENEGAFEHANNWTQEKFNKGVKINDDDVLFVNFDEFHIILSDLVTEKDNLLCFSITTSGFACGPSSSVVHFCFDMNY